jgi:hypothetical protein
MSGGGSAKEPQGAPAREGYIELAEKIYVNLAARVYGTLSGTEQKKPDPKALAAFSFKLADAFEQATRETDRMKAKIEAQNKAAVKLDQVDVSSFISAEKK